MLQHCFRFPPDFSPLLFGRRQLHTVFATLHLSFFVISFSCILLRLLGENGIWSSSSSIFILLYSSSAIFSRLGKLSWGTYTWSDGDVFEGQWEHGKKVVKDETLATVFAGLTGQLSHMAARAWVGLGLGADEHQGPAALLWWYALLAGKRRLTRDASCGEPRRGGNSRSAGAPTGIHAHDRHLAPCPAGPPPRTPRPHPRAHCAAARPLSPSRSGNYLPTYLEFSGFIMQKPAHA